MAARLRGFQRSRSVDGTGDYFHDNGHGDNELSCIGHPMFRRNHGSRWRWNLTPFRLKLIDETTTIRIVSDVSPSASGGGGSRGG